MVGSLQMAAVAVVAAGGLVLMVVVVVGLLVGLVVRPCHSMLAAKADIAQLMLMLELLPGSQTAPALVLMVGLVVVLLVGLVVKARCPGMPAPVPATASTAAVSKQMLAPCVARLLKTESQQWMSASTAIVGTELTSSTAALSTWPALGFRLRLLVWSGFLGSGLA